MIHDMISQNDVGNLFSQKMITTKLQKTPLNEDKWNFISTWLQDNNKAVKLRKMCRSAFLQNQLGGE